MDSSPLVSPTDADFVAACIPFASLLSRPAPMPWAEPDEFRMYLATAAGAAARAAGNDHLSSMAQVAATWPGRLASCLKPFVAAWVAQRGRDQPMGLAAHLGAPYQGRDANYFAQCFLATLLAGEAGEFARETCKNNFRGALGGFLQLSPRQQQAVARQIGWSADALRSGDAGKLVKLAHGGIEAAVTADLEYFYSDRASHESKGTVLETLIDADDLVEAASYGAAVVRWFDDNPAQLAALTYSETLALDRARATAGR